MVMWAADNDPWTPDQVMETAELVKRFRSGEVPNVFMVGPRILYNGNHIQGAVYAGPASSGQGIESLQHQMKAVPKKAPVLLYCGCCPMDHCPNIRPAFRALREMGYENVKILRIPVNLPTDWTSKGYPVEKGSIQLPR